MIFWKPLATSLRLLPWASGLAVLGIFSASLVSAQSITPDGTATLLNGGNSCSGSCLITGGTLKEGSLIHLFQTFNVDTGATVTFDDPGVANIIGQITTVESNNLSIINGTLAVSGTANLFLLNPNGIIFGTDAALNVPGSFIASTAENVVFNANVINSGDPTVIPLLTLNTPVGLQMGTNSRDIVVNTPTGAGGFAQLGGVHGQTLAFVGRNVELTTGAEIQVLDLAGSSGGAIHLQASDTLKMNGGTVENLLFGDGDGSNRINLEAPNLRLEEGTQVVLGSLGGGETGQIDVNADTLTIDNTNGPRSSFILTAVVSGSTATGGHINVTTDDIRLVEGGEISSRTLGAGSAGNVTIQNTGTIELTGFDPNGGGPSSIASIAAAPTAGPGGQVKIDTASLLVSGGGQIATSVVSDSNAG
ncbi:MAG: filamentous hemagglutinin N-terminal domain-containing protein, partial [Cyanobacteria bacterium P01_F01_bin.116]